MLLPTSPYHKLITVNGTISLGFLCWNPRGHPLSLLFLLTLNPMEVLSTCLHNNPHSSLFVSTTILVQANALSSSADQPPASTHALLPPESLGVVGHCLYCISNYATPLHKILKLFFTVFRRNPNFSP